MNSDELMLMAYVDGALNREGRRLVERRLAHDAEFRVCHFRLQQTAQLTKLSVAHIEAQKTNARTIGLLLSQSPSGIGSRRSRSARVGLAVLLIGVMLGAAGALGIRSMNLEMRHILGLDRAKDGMRS